MIREGAAQALNHRSPDYLNELRNLTGGRGPDVILEMLSNVNLAKDLENISTSGRIVVIGSRGKIEINPRDAMAKESAIFGLMLFNATPAELQAIHAAIYAGLQNGALNPVVGRRFCLADAARAHEAVLAPGAHGKMVLIP